MTIDIVVPVGMASEFPAPVVFGGVVPAVLARKAKSGLPVQIKIFRRSGTLWIIRQVIVPSEDIWRNRHASLVGIYLNRYVLCISCLEKQKQE